jgi:hypothetical protein
MCPSVVVEIIEIAMIRRRLIHVMLALMLLVTQHMAISHAMAHWANARETAGNTHQGADVRAAKSLAQDQTCDKCLAFAQIASAVGSPSGNAMAIAESSVEVAPRVCNTGVQRCVVVFRSRAPPAVA